MINVSEVSVFEANDDILLCVAPVTRPQSRRVTTTTTRKRVEELLPD